MNTPTKTSIYAFELATQFYTFATCAHCEREEQLESPPTQQESLEVNVISDAKTIA